MSEPSPTLSIVIVNWNTRELLLRVLGQLFDAPRLPMEVIVVDNASSDGSVAAARERFPAAVVLQQPDNGGFAYGVNRGLQEARGRWVLLLNTDADADQQQLERFVQDAERDAEAGVFGPRIVDEHGQTQPSTWPRHRPRHYLPNALFLSRLFASRPRQDRGDVDCVSGCVFLIRRDLLATTGGFDERFFMYFEEADFCERARRHGFAVRYLPDASFVHVGGLSAAQSAERTFVAFRESTLLYHVAWHGRFWR
ncbi:MAG: glycosyltransferase family 2 protein, partial [Planctomycetes bacterium]|nr:glycosyltransferase family 2 protein [Planctomycetota bacterium]